MNAAPSGPLVRQAAAPPEAYDAWVAGSAHATFFHTRFWMDAVCRHAPGAAPLWLVAQEEGQPVGVMPAVQRRRGPWRMLAAHHDGAAAGPLCALHLAAARQDAAAAALLAAFGRLARGARTLAATLVLPAAADARWGAAAAAAGLDRRSLAAAVLPLAGGLAEVEMHVFKKNRRNERNRALRAGCVAGVTQDPAVLDEYYPIYAAAAARWRIRPAPLPLLRFLLAEGRGTVFLAWVRHGGRLLGAHLCFHHGTEVIAWNGATRPEESARFPSTLLIWADLQEACARGALRLDLGGSGGIGSLLRFKQLLGARAEERGLYRAASPLYGLWERLRARGAGSPDGGRGGS